jgi:hypothetical protein
MFSGGMTTLAAQINDHDEVDEKSIDDEKETNDDGSGGSDRIIASIVVAIVIVILTIVIDYYYDYLGFGIQSIKTMTSKDNDND